MRAVEINVKTTCMLPNKVAFEFSEEQSESEKKENFAVFTTDSDFNHPKTCGIEVNNKLSSKIVSLESVCNACYIDGTERISISWVYIGTYTTRRLNDSKVTPEILISNDRCVVRIVSYIPSWPMKIFFMTSIYVTIFRLSYK